jgi:hypothetical protein
MDSTGSEQNPIVGFGEQGKNFILLKSREFLNMLRNYTFFKEDPIPQS